MNTSAPAVVVPSAIMAEPAPDLDVAQRGPSMAKRIGFTPRAGRAAVLPAAMIYGVEDKPSLGLTAFAGLQWVGLINVYLVFLLVLVRAGDVPPPTVAAMVGLSMLALGAAALLQALPRGPVGSGYLAPSVLSANYLGPSILAIKLGGLPLVFGMTIFAGFCEAALSPFVSRLKGLFPIEIQGLVVFLIASSSAQSAFA